MTRFEVAALRVAELAGLDAGDMTGAQFDSLALAQDTMAESRWMLEQAGLLHLIDTSTVVPAVAK
ncbi:hypothetical protein [Streptomyces sp. NPDC059649]|uniref:hypothetical protein n=1 Tax=Streptomyces sp. NPDC059649 TaxID=3346895 RepID=UPI003676D124